MVEKILEPARTLPADWPCAGTTGLRRPAPVDGLFVDPPGRAALTDAYDRLTGAPADFADGGARRPSDDVAERRPGRRGGAAGPTWSPRCAADPALPTSPGRGLRDALVELLVALRRLPRLRRARRARRRRGGGDGRRARPRPGTGWPEDRTPTWTRSAALALEPLGADRGAATSSSSRFQQTTGPVMAKGVEDTAFYR